MSVDQNVVRLGHQPHPGERRAGRRALLGSRVRHACSASNISAGMTGPFSMVDAVSIHLLPPIAAAAAAHHCCRPPLRTCCPADREQKDEEESGIFHRAERVSSFRGRALRMVRGARGGGEVLLQRRLWWRPLCFIPVTYHCEN